MNRLSRGSLLAVLGSGTASLALGGQAHAQVAPQATTPLPSVTGPGANPYWNGINPFVSYPQKLPLLRVTDRGIQLETPRPYFLTPFTPNAAFYVRYHLDLIPNAIDLRTPGGPRGQARSCSTSPRTPGSTCSRLTRGLTVLSRARVGTYPNRGGATAAMEQQLIGGVGMTSSLIGLGTWAMGGWMWGGGDDAEAIKGGWVAYRKPRRKRRLDGLEGLLAERFRQARASMCNAWRSGAIARSMVGSDTATPCSRTKSWRTTSQLPRCCVRFETPPGKQLQIDFGERRVVIGGEPVRVYLFVATLGYSRRIFLRAFRHERQSTWFDGMEGAFRHFGGMPQEVLLDNARALVEHHDPATREVRFNERLLAFARYSGIRARACAPAARIKSDLTDSSMIRRVGRPSLSELVL